MKGDWKWSEQKIGTRWRLSIYLKKKTHPKLLSSGSVLLYASLGLSLIFQHVQVRRCAESISDFLVLSSKFGLGKCSGKWGNLVGLKLSPACFLKISKNIFRFFSFFQVVPTPEMEKLSCPWHTLFRQSEVELAGLIGDFILYKYWIIKSCANSSAHIIFLDKRINNGYTGYLFYPASLSFQQSNGRHC